MNPRVPQRVHRQQQDSLFSRCFSSSFLPDLNQTAQARIRKQARRPQAISPANPLFKQPALACPTQNELINASDVSTQS